MLSQELKAKIEKRGAFMGVFHPLVVIYPYAPSDWDYKYNAMLEHKKLDILYALKKRDYRKYVFLHERPFRLQAFLDIYMRENPYFHKNPKKYWSLLKEVWVDCESPYINKSVWIDLFQADLPHREYLMSGLDRNRFNKLPDEITIYRGYDGKGKEGISWTLNESIAQFFAKRFNRKGEVIKKTIPKNKAIALIRDRGEDEIIFIK